MKKTDELVNHCPFCGSESIEWMGDAFGEETPFHCHECDKWFSAEFVWNDFCDEAVTAVSRMLTDEVYRQNGITNANEDSSDDSWYELQEELREKMLEAAAKVINNSNFYSV